MKIYNTWLLLILFIIYLSSCWKIDKNEDSTNSNYFVDSESDLGGWYWEPTSQTWSRK